MSNHNKETEARCPHCYRHYVEGTAAWALYMMRMGRKVTNPDDPRVYYLPEGGIIQVDGMEMIAGNKWIDYWCIDIPDGWQLYEPHHDFNVGDWVEFRDIEGIKHGIIEGRREEYIVLCNGISQSVGDKFITRKLDPSEVVVHIGCLSGTVAPGCSDAIIMIVPIGYNGFGDVAIIPVAMLDAPTRSLVGKLLKAQEEE
jgi:hypothetical protein